MSARLLKRLEDLLRLGLDSGTTFHERQTALREALRTVTVARQGLGGGAGSWREATTMRRRTCERCGDSIQPAKKCWQRGDDYRCADCNDPEVH